MTDGLDALPPSVWMAGYGMFWHAHAALGPSDVLGNAFPLQRCQGSFSIVVSLENPSHDA